MKLVSIIVCTYNQEGTIRRCLDAILAQESKWPFEVIIGEDGGTDSTRTICEEYVKSYPDIVRLMPKAPNKGIVDNYYDCIREAKGEYIMECGGDDEWCPGRINLCLDIMEKHPSVVQIFTDVWYRNEITKRITTRPSTLFPYGMLKGAYVIERMFHQHHDQMVSYAMTRRSAIMQVMKAYPQFFSGRKYLCEDKQLVTLLGTVGDFYYVDTCTYYYSVDTPSITHSNNQARNYNYSKNMLLLNRDLAEALHYDNKELTDIYADISYCMLTRVLLTCDISLRNELAGLLQEYGIVLHGKNRLLLMLMKNPFIWHLALSCYLLTIHNK